MGKSAPLFGCCTFGGTGTSVSSDDFKLTSARECLGDVVEYFLLVSLALNTHDAIANMVSEVPASAAPFSSGAVFGTGLLVTSEYSELAAAQQECLPADYYLLFMLGRPL